MTDTEDAKAAELDEIWKDDHLGRRDDAAWLEVFLRNRSAELANRGEPRSYVLNLDAQWGAGKTFFLTRLQQQLEGADHLAVYVNAWRDDFADDPLIAVMAAIDETVESHRELTRDAKAKWETVKEKTGRIARIAGKGLLKRGIGFIITAGAVDAVEEALTGAEQVAPETEERVANAVKSAAEALTDGINQVIDSRSGEEVSDFRAQQTSIQTFRETLAEFVVAVEHTEGKKAPFFVLVDELDRCRPPYAIAMLERIKHLFEIPGVVFIVATDSRQLGHAIRAVYGTDFESARYLRRFFDQIYEFEDPSLKAFTAYLMDREPISSEKLSSPWDNDHAAFLTDFFVSSNTDLRTVEQIYNHLHSMASAWDEPAPIELVVALPLMMAFAHRQPIANMKEAIQAYAPTQWIMTWYERQIDNPRDSKLRQETVRNLAVDLLTRVEHPLQELVHQNRRGSRASHWVDERIYKEFQQRAPGILNQRGSPLMSLLNSYPKRISQAGRIKQDPAIAANGNR